MADRDGGIGVQQQHRNRFANNVTAPDNDGIRADYRNIASLQNFHAAKRRASYKPGALSGKISHVHRMKSVHVFLWRNREQHSIRIHLLRKRQLNEDAINFITMIEVRSEEHTS